MKSVWRWYYWQLDNGWSGSCVRIYEPNGNDSQSFGNLVMPITAGSNQTINIRFSADEFAVEPVESSLWTSRRSKQSYHRQTVIKVNISCHIIPIISYHNTTDRNACGCMYVCNRFPALI
jgi:hypothetical protein